MLTFPRYCSPREEGSEAGRQEITLGKSLCIHELTALSSERLVASGTLTGLCRERKRVEWVCLCSLVSLPRRCLISPFQVAYALGGGAYPGASHPSEETRTQAGGLHHDLEEGRC